MKHRSRKAIVLELVVLLAGFTGCMSHIAPQCRISSTQSLLLMDAIDRQMRSVRLEILDGGLSHDQIVRIWCNRSITWRSVLEEIKNHGAPAESRIAVELLESLERPLFNGFRMVTVRCSTQESVTIDGNMKAVTSLYEGAGRNRKKMVSSAVPRAMTVSVPEHGIKKFVNQTLHVL